MTAGESIAFDSFRRIRDRALLLSLGRAYLCETPILSKSGIELEQALAIAERDIQELKKRFPGRFVREVDTDRILNGMQELARRLKEPDRALQEECTVGALGKDLEERLRALSDAVRDVRLQVKGGPPADYSGKDAVAGAFYRAADTARRGVGVLGRIVVVTVAFAAVAFGFLFATMEREGRFEDEIARNQEQVRVLEKDLSVLEEEMITLKRRIREMERKGRTRQDKVRAMELSVQLDELEQKAVALYGGVEMHQRSIHKAEASLEALRRKGFLDRLLRK